MPRRPISRRRSTLLISLVGVLLCACTHGASSRSSSASRTQTSPVTTASLVFSSCPPQITYALPSVKRATELTFTCGFLPVPLDYAHPAGARVELFVMKVHLKAQQPSQHLGSVLLGSGGPGQDGSDLALYLSDAISEEVLDHFDLVAFDPRGAGLSSPLVCLSIAQKEQLLAADPNVGTTAGQAAARSLGSGIAHTCAAKYGANLGFYNTEDTARDIDQIRAGLGDAKVNYLGFSYGTKLGAAYAHLFPAKLRTAVFDAPNNPDDSDLTIAAEQAHSLESAFDQFAADCRTRTACAVLGDPRAAVTTLIAHADKTPIHTSASTDTRTATGGAVITAIIAGLYDQATWSQLGDALVSAQHGDAAGLFTLADPLYGRDATGHWDNFDDANIAINCNDSVFTVDDAVIGAAATQWAATYPIFGLTEAWGLYLCSGWPTSGHPTPPATAPTSPKLLVIGTVHDPDAPYPSASAFTQKLGNAALLTWDGQGHTAYPQTSCITTKVDAYLISAKAEGGTCPP